MRIIDGSVTEQYANLWDYCEELLIFNPSSAVKMQCKAMGSAVTKFEKLYVCLDSCKKGFLGGCTPIVGVDGYFIKGFNKGQLLVDVGIDPHKEIYPIAYTVVESECYETWHWFLSSSRKTWQQSTPIRSHGYLIDKKG